MLIRHIGEKTKIASATSPDITVVGPKSEFSYNRFAVF